MEKTWYSERIQDLSATVELAMSVLASATERDGMTAEQCDDVYYCLRGVVRQLGILSAAVKCERKGDECHDDSATEI